MREQPDLHRAHDRDRVYDDGSQADQGSVVYGYISNVDTTWSCTAFLRWSGISWNLTANAGRFDWGNLINSTSVSCNYLVGSTDYMKGNGIDRLP